MLMLARSVAVLAFGALYSYAQEEASPKGVHPCATPDDYAVKAQGKGDTHISTEAHVGYESGRNPVTRPLVHGTYSGAGVGVEPSGKFDHVVAGYLYFPKATAKVKKDALGNYVLEHCG